MIPAAAPGIAAALAKSLAPRKPLTVSQWADANRKLAEGSAKPGRWRTEANPPLREPMDCLSNRSPVHEVVVMFPIQSGKTDGIALNAIGYVMDHAPERILVALPSESSRNIWIDEKLKPALDATDKMRAALTSTASRDSANQRAFKAFFGGSLRVQHAGAPERLKSSSVPILIVDELDAFANNLGSGDDPIELLRGRTSAFPSRYKALYISTPGIEGVSRIKQLWDKSDQRRYYVPCPHCGHEQPLVWAGFHWSSDYTHAWYVCYECSERIEEHQKTEMIRRGHWVAENPRSKIRGYHLNCLYYQFGLGPRWLTLAEEWRDAQGDPAKLKTFTNDRLAETWEDQAMRAVKQNMIADRAEPRPLRPVPWWVLAATSGVDTQDNRLAVQILGWGRDLRCWPIDYVELFGDPAEDEVWTALVDLLSRPIEHEWGGLLRVEAGAIDMMGHRTEAVKAFVRKKLLRRQMAIFGATNNNAPVLGKGKLYDINWRGQMDKRGVMAHAVGTVAIKHLLYSRLSADADKDIDERWLRFSEQLGDDYFGGLVSEVYNPKSNRFDKRRGAPRNEPLDTWAYGYAATHHPELRLHRSTKADWDQREQRLRSFLDASRETQPEPPKPALASRETPRSVPATPGNARPDFKRAW